MNAAVSPSAAAPAVPAAPVSLSPTRRAWRRFARNRLGYWSLLLFCVLVVLSLGAELISNDRPLVVRYAGLGFNPLQVEGDAPTAHIDNVGMLRDIFAAIFPDLGDVQLGRLRDVERAKVSRAL